MVDIIYLMWSLLLLPPLLQLPLLFLQPGQSLILRSVHCLVTHSLHTVLQHAAGVVQGGQDGGVVVAVHTVLTIADTGVTPVADVDLNLRSGHGLVGGWVEGIVSGLLNVGGERIVSWRILLWKRIISWTWILCWEWVVSWIVLNTIHGRRHIKCRRRWGWWGGDRRLTPASWCCSYHL